MSHMEGQVGRSTSDSTTSSERSRISVIEKSVTHLLVATKALLETLTKWSKRQATESEVSDVYVRLGYEFNIACRAFKSVGVETSDLGPVPDLLRDILEETLSGEPSHSHLDKYLPRIRDIIVNLLQGLKRKQQRLRQRHAKDKTGPGGEARQSVSLGAQSTSDITEAATGQSSGQTEAMRQDSVDYSDARHETNKSQPRSAPTDPSQRSVSETMVSAAPSTTAPAIYFTEGGTANAHDGNQLDDRSTRQDSPSRNVIVAGHGSLQVPDAESPQSNGKKGDALAALQRGGELERRASRRFSAYQIQKHLGNNSGGSAMIPPTQSSPIPNRGRDLRESLTAVRTRATPPHYGRDYSQTKYASDGSPVRQPTEAKTGPDAGEAVAPQPQDGTSTQPITERSPIAKTPEDKLGRSYPEVNQPRPNLGTRDLIREADDPFTGRSAVPEPTKRLQKEPSTETLVRHSSRAKTPPPRGQSTETPSNDSPPSRETTLFLQYKSRVKKFVLAEGHEELSIGRLQLAFIEKFAWNTHSNGVDLPEIYIQDHISGIRHELEDLADVKSRSVLVLNVDPVDEVKKHVDDGMGGLRDLLQDVQTAVSEQAAALQRLADQQLDAASELTRLAAQAVPTVTPPSTRPVLANGDGGRPSPSSQIEEMQSLRKDLAVMRQTYSSWVSEVEHSLSTFRAVPKYATDLVREQDTPASVDGIVGSGSSRAYVTSAKKTLNSTSEAIMTRVEDLQDTVEDLRKDVVTRGVRPLPHQLETVSKEIGAATVELKRLQEYMRREKPTWTKIWKDELQSVCDDQALIKYQEELAADLESDLENATETFALVEEATKQQNLVNAGRSAAAGTAFSPTNSRNTSRTLTVGADPLKAKDGVLDEVKALQPNHESRLEAIERAERLRQKELEERKDGEFKKELSGFVDEGRLKKSGGFEETERVRKVKDERMRKQVWNRINGRPDSFDATTEATSQVDVAVASLDSVLPHDLGSLAGSGLPPDASAEKADAAIADSATVPLPLDVQVESVRALTPEPEFVEAAERQHGSA